MLDALRSGAVRFARRVVDSIDSMAAAAPRERSTDLVQQSAGAADAVEAVRLLPDAAMLEQMPAGEAARAVQHAVDSILDLPDDAIDVGRIRELHDARSLPAHLRPEFPPTLRSGDPFGEAVRQGWPGLMPVPRDELAVLRIDRMRRAIQADPAATAATLDDELRSLIARADEQVTRDDLRRIAALDRLPDDVRPTLLREVSRLPNVGARSSLGVVGDVSANSPARAALRELRVLVEAEAIAADPAVSASTVQRELVDTLAAPSWSLDERPLLRIGAFDRLPDGLRPLDVPRTSAHKPRFADLGIREQLPALDRDYAASFDDARRTYLDAYGVEPFVEAIRARVERGDLLDLALLDELAVRDGDALARAGVTDDVLREQGIASLAAAGGWLGDVARGMGDEVSSVPEIAGPVMRARVHDDALRVLDRFDATRELVHVAAIDGLARAGSTSRLELLEQLRLVQARLRSDPVQPGMAEVRDGVLEHIERNLARMDGTRRDTYARHPDYAEVGRASAGVRLLRSADGDAAASAPTQVRIADERLDW